MIATPIRVALTITKKLDITLIINIRDHSSFVGPNLIT